MRRLIMSRLIRIYTVYHSVLIIDWHPYFEQWFWQDSKVEEYTSEIQVWKVYSNSSIKHSESMTRTLNGFVAGRLLWFSGITCHVIHVWVIKLAFRHMRPTKSQNIMRILLVWSESSLSAWRNFASLAIQNAPSEDSDLNLRWAHIFEGTFFFFFFFFLRFDSFVSFTAL